MIRTFTRVLLTAILLTSLRGFTQEHQRKEESKKLQMSLYGFLKGDLFYATGGVYSWGNPQFNYLTTPQFASGVDRPVISLTAQHSRVGLKGTTGERIKGGGLLEVDFYNGPSDASVRPRIRLGYASVAYKGFEARFGQQWDLFSAQIASTVNTNGNLWFAGNKGFRRPQMSMFYSFQTDFVEPMIQLSIGESAREDGTQNIFLGKDNLAGIPMLQARLSGKFSEKYTVGLAFAHATFKELKGTSAGNGTLAEDFTFQSSGVCLDFHLPVHRYFSLTGEINTGKNLNNASLFSAAGNFYYSLDSDERPVKFDRKSTGVWFNATSVPAKWLTVVIGYGTDRNLSETYQVDAIKKNSMLYGDLIFPFHHGFSLTLEIAKLNTTVVSAVDQHMRITSTKENQAMVFALSGRINF